MEREVRFARVEMLRAALSAVEGVPADEELAAVLRRRYEVMLHRAEAELTNANHRPADTSEADAALVRAATSAERQRLLALRADRTIGDAAFQQVEQELDLEELDLQQLAPGA